MCLTITKNADSRDTCVLEDVDSIPQICVKMANISFSANFFHLLRKTKILQFLQLGKSNRKLDCPDMKIFVDISRSSPL